MTSYPKPNSPKDIQTSYPSKTASSCTVDNEHYSTAPSTIVGKLDAPHTYEPHASVWARGYYCHADTSLL
eukprot:223852-Pyramimonas_sp.AAC.1